MRLLSDIFYHLLIFTSMDQIFQHKTVLHPATGLVRLTPTISHSHPLMEHPGPMTSQLLPWTTYANTNRFTSNIHHFTFPSMDNTYPRNAIQSEPILQTIGICMKHPLYYSSTTNHQPHKTNSIYIP